MKLLPAVCAAAFCTSLISVRADDSPVQAAARAALEQKMNQLDNPQAPASPASAISATNVAKAAPTAKAPAPAPKPVVPAPQAAPAVVAPVVTSTPAAAAPAAPAPAAAAVIPVTTAPAAAAPVEAPPAPAPSAPETVAAPATPEPSTPPAAETKPAESAMTPEPAAAAPAAAVAPPAMAAPAASETPAMAPQDAARAALYQKMNELNHSQGLPVSSSISPVSPGVAQQTGMPNPASQVTAVVPGKELGLNSIEAPYVPITAAQEAQLDDLLAKYKANEITPLEYHKQRAAILARHQP